MADRRGKSKRGIRTVFALLVLVVIGVFVVTFMGAIDNDDKLMQRATSAMPVDESHFTKITADFGGSKFIDANVLQLVPMRRARAKAFCSAVTDGQVKNWVGRAEAVSATTAGDAILHLYLYGPGSVEIENWNEKTNAIEDKMPIAQDSPMFSVISTLKSLDLVRFDGELQSHGNDCFRTDGSEQADEDGNLAQTMMSPTFVFRFTNVRRLD